MFRTGLRDAVLIMFCMAAVANGQTASDNTGMTAGLDPTTLPDTVKDVFKDQKKVYVDFPAQLSRGHDWIPVVVIVGTAAGLAVADQYESSYFRQTSAFHGFNSGLSSTNTSLLIAGVPAATYLYGFLAKDSYSKSTALLAGESAADSLLLDEILKLATRRARPESISSKGNFADTWFDSRTITDGSFPSGHTIAAFSVATIMSRRYGGRHRWVPYVSYAAAGAIGFSRVSLSAHSVSDVFIGAALGYAISRYVVLRHHP